MLARCPFLVVCEMTFHLTFVFWIFMGIIGVMMAFAVLFVRQCRMIDQMEYAAMQRVRMTCDSGNEGYQPPRLPSLSDGDAYIPILDDDENPVSHEAVSTNSSFPMQVGGDSPYMAYYLQRLHPTIRALAMHQWVADREAALSVPMLHEDYENIFQQGQGTVRLTLGTRIAKGTYSMVFEVGNNETMVFKYQVNCDRLGRIHSLARDYWFLRELSQSGVVPMSYFLSPPVRLPANDTLVKTSFNMDPDVRRMCVADRRSEVRYMVMGKARLTMSTLMVSWHAKGRGIPFKWAIIIGQGMVQALRVVHSRGIIHGDIHSGNVVLLDIGQDNVGFIDFGLSLFSAEWARKQEKVNEELENPFCVYSMYENLGFRRSFRDDLYRAVLLMAMLMNDATYYGHCMDLEQEPLEMLKFKRDSFLFSNPVGPDVVSAIPGMDREDSFDIRQHLAKVLRIVRNLRQIDELPPYDSVLKELNAIHSLLPDASRPRVSSDDGGSGSISE